jgi:hypothetical protein
MQVQQQNNQSRPQVKAHADLESITHQEKFLSKQGESPPKRFNQQTFELS